MTAPWPLDQAAPGVADQTNSRRTSILTINVSDDRDREDAAAVLGRYLEVPNLTVENALFFLRDVRNGTVVDEPPGLFAVVREADNRTWWRWTADRGASSPWAPARDSLSDQPGGDVDFLVLIAEAVSWSELAPVEVLSEGITP